jgi:hypothetical protein
MIHAQRPVAICALPDLCLRIIFQLGHLRLPTNLVQMASLGPPPAACPWRVGALRKCVVLAIRINGPCSDFGGSSCRAARSHE